MLRYSYVYRVEYTYCWDQGQELDSNLFPIPWSSPLYSRPPRLRSLRLNPHHLLSLFPFLLLPSLCSCRRRPWPASPTSSTSTSPTPRRRSSPSTYGTYGNVLLVNPHATAPSASSARKNRSCWPPSSFSWRFGVRKRALVGRRVGTKDLCCV